MRDPKRIKRILDKINKIWKSNPDQRMFQLFINLGLVLDDSTIWNIEDEDTEKRIDNYLKTKKFRGMKK